MQMQKTVLVTVTGNNLTSSKFFLVFSESKVAQVAAIVCLIISLITGKMSSRRETGENPFSVARTLKSESK